MSKDEKFKYGKAVTVVLCFAVLLTVFGIVMSVRGAIIGRTPVPRLITVFAGFALILFYAAWGYKKPHGNLLRYVMLGFALLMVLTFAADSMGGGPKGMPPMLGEALEGFGTGQPPEGAPDFNARTYELLLTGVAVMLVSYMAGRLHKVEQNKYIFGVLLIVLIVRSLVNYQVREIMFLDMSEVIVGIDLNCVYLFRYRQHKEAGLEDKA